MATENELRELLYQCVIELSYIQSVDNCTSGICASSKGAELVEAGMKVLGVKCLSGPMLPRKFRRLTEMSPLPESKKAKRIQRKRTRGWKMPEGAVYVGRPTKWGNPFSVQTWGLALSLALFRDAANGIWSPSTLPSAFEDWRFHDAVLLATNWRETIGAHPVEMIRAGLRGLDLACWCPEDQLCHADVLLEIANGE